MGLQVVFGTGPIGLHTAAALIQQGNTVRLVNRSGSLSPLRRSIAAELKDSAIEVIKADALNRAEVLQAAEGASHIFHCINPQYHQWASVLPLVQENMIEAALRQNAVLAVSENLYMYKRGIPVINLTSPVDPPSKKGAIREELHGHLKNAENSRGLKWTAVRGSDYYGPGATDQSMFGTERFLDPLFKKGRVALIGKLNVPHTYTYVKDFGRALAVAAHSDNALGKPWIVANSETGTTVEIAEMFARKAARQGKFSTIPRFFISLLGMVDPVIRELPEMLYQKEEPYVVDGSAFTEEFNFAVTGMEEGIGETIAWYRNLHTQA